MERPFSKRTERCPCQYQRLECVVAEMRRAGCRGTSLININPPLRTTIGLQAKGFCRVLREGCFLWARHPCSTFCIPGVESASFTGKPLQMLRNLSRLERMLQPERHKYVATCRKRQCSHFRPGMDCVDRSLAHPACQGWDMLLCPRYHPSLQGYLAHKKQRFPRTLQQHYAWGLMVVLGGGGRF